MLLTTDDDDDDDDNDNEHDKRNWTKPEPMCVDSVDAHGERRNYTSVGVYVYVYVSE
jgi:hypothetical protein